MIRPLPWPSLFPYTTLFRSGKARLARAWLPARLEHFSRVAHVADSVEPELDPVIGANRHAPGDNVLSLAGADERGPDLDRKSTRLNSSHRCNSYAVFCLQQR